MPRPQNELTLSQIRYFVRAAELGSMTEAAGELFVAQSAISTAISHLEASLGCKLLVRQRSRGVVLTEQGRSFYTRAMSVLHGLDDAVDSVRPEQLSGWLTAGCFTTLAPFWLPEVYDALTSKYSDLTVRIREVTADQIHPLLLRRELEIALTYSFDYGREVTFEPICEAPIYAAVADASPLAARESITLEELADEPLILLDLGKSTNYFLSIFREARLQPQVHQRFESFEVVRSMVARGHGYTLLNQRPAHDLTNDGGRIARLRIDGARSLLQIGLAYRSGEALSRKGQAFADECRRIFSDD
ncbi:LysR family transcriptional regulator [Nesterenkonia xinjiangensis]|uniref:DNA-binding transcriptional LysR family regulator n=1 Tax=Nesterenkonia xinjiangensis TaxID=225327 RepID=A0A7Z0GKY2_9MICC|nr:LysR family transcriptional regulator [Nesterenkonia xinjiangensis]NYJ77921.1 DNA-binding transcriptional LysR family regulator [Nesterenkonia xinjiangensis]